MPELLQLNASILELRRLIIENNGCSTQEINTEILTRIKRRYKDIEIKNGNEKKTIAVSLNHCEKKLCTQIKLLHGIPITQLYIRELLDMANEEKIK